VVAKFIVLATSSSIYAVIVIALRLVQYLDTALTAVQ